MKKATTFISAFVVSLILLSTQTTKVFAQMQCGSPYFPANGLTCECSTGEVPYGTGGLVCCGWVFTNPENTVQMTCSSTPNNPFLTGGGDLTITEGVSTETFNALNPLQIGGGDTIFSEAPSQYAAQLSTPGGIVSRVLEFAFPIAGLILFLILVWGGFEMLTGAATKKSLDAGKQRVTAALVGFFLLFATYWIGQLLEVIFGIVIL